MRIGIVAAAFAAIMSAVLSANAEEDDIAAIRIVRAASNAAIAAHDADAFYAYHDQDYVITFGSSKKGPPREQDIEELRQMFADLPDVLYVRTPHEIKLSEALPLAMERGTWVGTWTAENGPVEYRGSYAAGWRKTDGKWHIHSELFVTLSCKGTDCP